VVSEADRRLARGLEHAAVIANGVDTEQFAFREPAGREPTLLFFGNLGYFHNVKPARYVAEQVLPRVRARAPRATLRIAGARPHPSVKRLARLDGVEVVGPVAAIADELHRAAVAVLPTFSGSGIKNKLLESFSAGTPVVANAHAIECVAGASAGRDYLAAESADDFADACVELLTSPARGIELARSARTLVEREFTWERQVNALIELYSTGRPELALQLRGDLGFDRS
jgi:glycosyltransferase involved in cell wall biosynthesis